MTEAVDYIVAAADEMFCMSHPLSSPNSESRRMNMVQIVSLCGLPVTVSQTPGS